MKTKIIYTTLTVIVLAIIVSSVAAVTYLYPPSNTAQIIGATPSPSPTEPPITVNTVLTVSLLTVPVGQPAILTAQLNQALSGKTVNFYEGATVAAGTFLGSGVTDTSGKATFLIAAVTEGPHTYIAQPQQ